VIEIIISMDREGETDLVLNLNIACNIFHNRNINKLFDIHISFHGNIYFCSSPSALFEAF
jgi:hypothetical protein